jgi:hypothetical protein
MLNQPNADLINRVLLDMVCNDNDSVQVERNVMGGHEEITLTINGHCYARIRQALSENVTFQDAPTSTHQGRASLDDAIGSILDDLGKELKARLGG